MTNEPGQARVVLYVREGCHLCGEARDAVTLACEAAGEIFVERDIDADAALRDQYGEYVPVVTVDGVQQGMWRIDGDRVRRALLRSAGPGAGVVSPS